MLTIVFREYMYLFSIFRGTGWTDISTSISMKVLNTLTSLSCPRNHELIQRWQWKGRWFHIIWWTQQLTRNLVERWQIFLELCKCRVRGRKFPTIGDRVTDFLLFIRILQTRSSFFFFYESMPRSFAIVFKMLTFVFFEFSRVAILVASYGN